MATPFRVPGHERHDVVDDGDILLARIVIEHKLTDDHDIVSASFEDSSGGKPPLLEILGMLTMTIDTAQRSCEDADDDEDDDPSRDG